MWNVKSGACISTLSTGYCLSAVFVPGGRHIVVGTKAGKLELYEIGSGSLLETVDAHEGAVWSITLLPDKSGIASGSADHSVKFWEFDLISDSTYSNVQKNDTAPLHSQVSKRLSLKLSRTLPVEDDALFLRFSPTGKVLAVALLDSTIKVYMADTLKFYLSLYGHKVFILALF